MAQQPEILPATIRDARSRLGEPVKLHEDATPDTIRRDLEALERDHILNDAKDEAPRFSHLAHYEVLSRKHRLLLLQKKEDLGEPVDRLEMQALALAITHIEYLPRTVTQYLDTWDKYVALTRNPLLPPIPPELKQREDRLHGSLIEINGLLQARNALGTAQIALMRQAGGARANEAQALLGQLAGKQELPGEIRTALAQKNYRQAAGLLPAAMLAVEGRIIATIAGDQGQAKGDNLLNLYADGLRSTYRTLAERERGMAKSGMPYVAKQKVLAAIAGDRTRVASEMVSATSDIGNFQIDMAELTALQHMFDVNDLAKFARFDVAPSGIPKAQLEKIRADLLAFLVDRTQKRLTGIQQHLQYIEDNVLTIGMKVEAEHLWNKKGRPAVEWTIAKVVNILTYPLPAELRDRQREYMMGPLYEALGFPPGKRDFDALTTEEKAKVEERATSIKDLILAFDQSTLHGARNTAGLIQEMQKQYPAAEYLGQRALPWKDEDKDVVITGGNLDALVKKYNVATVYQRAFKDLRGSFGEFDPPSGYIAELRKLTDGIQKNMTVHSEVGAALREVARRIIPIPDLHTWLLLGATGTGALVGDYAGRAIGVLPIRRGPRALPLIAAGYFGLETYADWHAADAFNRHEREVKAEVRAMVMEMEEQLKKNSKFEKRDTVYVHRESGVNITLKSADDLDSFLNTQMLTYYVQTAEDAAMTTASLGVLRKGKNVLGPWGIALACVDIAADQSIGAWRNANILTFLRDAPPWALAKFGSAYLTGRREHDIAAHASSWRTSDFFHNLKDPEKQDIRMKLLFTMFQQELSLLGPQIFEIMADRNTLADVDVLAVTDFPKIIFPYFCMSAMRNTGIDWEEIHTGKVGREWFFLPDRLTALETRRAMREASVFYLQHLRQLPYVKALKQQKELRDPRQQADNAYVLSVLGRDKAFGKTLQESLKPDNVEASGFRTPAEVAAQMLTENQGSTTLPRPVPGLPMRDFSTAGVLYDTIEDPGLRRNLERIVPQTIDEPGGALTPEWYRRYLAPVLGGRQDIVPFGTPVAEFPRKFSRSVIDDILQRIGKTSGTVERTPDNISTQAAVDLLTPATIRLLHATRGEQTLLQRNPEMESRYEDTENARHPIVLTNGITGVKEVLDRFPLPSRETGKEFDRGNILAVVLEQHPLKEGGNVILRTIVYGDATNRQKMYVLQDTFARADKVDADADTFGLSRSVLRREYNTKRVPTLGHMHGPALASSIALLEQHQRGMGTVIDQVKQIVDKQRTEEARRREAAGQAPGRALRSTDLFVRTAPGEHRFRYDNATMIRIQEPGPSFRAVPPDGMNPGESLTFTVIDAKGKETTQTIPDGFFRRADDNTISRADKERMQKVVTTPFENVPGGESDRESLRKVIDLFPYEKRGRMYYSGELIHQLLPLYQSAVAAKKSAFLNELFIHLERENGATRASVPKIVRWYNEHMNIYR